MYRTAKGVDTKSGDTTVNKWKDPNLEVGEGFSGQSWKRDGSEKAEEKGNMSCLMLLQKEPRVFKLFLRLERMT